MPSCEFVERLGEPDCGQPAEYGMQCRPRFIAKKWVDFYSCDEHAVILAVALSKHGFHVREAFLLEPRTDDQESDVHREPAQAVDGD